MSFFDKHASSQVKQFEEVAKGKTKEETRYAEEHLLKPKQLLTDKSIKTKHKSELSSRKVLFVFRNKAQKDLVGEVFDIKVSVNDEMYINDIELLESIARGVREGKYQIVDNEIQLVTGPKTTEHWHENEEGTIKAHLPDEPFKTLTDAEEATLKKKKLKKYHKILDEWDVEKMNKFRATHFPPVKATRMRRKI